ncbi:MAG: lipase chaperone LimK [Oleispira sp.]|jgi:lipase chaperone LimK
MTKNNNKITIIFSLSIAMISLFFFELNANNIIEKPIMDNELQPLLTSNKIAFEKVISEKTNTSGDFHKAIPKSLEGVDLNIALPLDRDGNLIVGMELKDLFELYLSATGEEELDDILLRIQHALAQQLTSPALEQGYDALKRFIDYKVELANLEKQPLNEHLSELDNIRRQKEILATIQQEYFTPIESDALFAAETEYDAFMLTHLTIQQNQQLTAEEKQQQIEALEMSLPEDVRASRESAMAAAKMYQQTETMKAEGKSATEIYHMRSQSLGEEAATALAQLDQQRAHWQQRLGSFSSKYQSITHSGLSEEDQLTEVNAILARDFNATESIRVRALTGI